MAREKFGIQESWPALRWRLACMHRCFQSRSGGSGRWCTKWSGTGLATASVSIVLASKLPELSYGDFSDGASYMQVHAYSR